MWRVFLTACVFAISISMSAFAQSAEDRKAAGDVADKLFDAMRAKSFDGIRAVFTPDGQLVAIDKARDGKGLSKTRIFTAESFAKAISESKAADLIEKMPAKTVTVAGDLAIVTGRYTFHVGDKFSHCGTNTFNLVRTETGWLIANGASTLEFQCDADLKPAETAKMKEFVIVLKLQKKYQDDKAWTNEANAAVGRHFEKLQAMQKSGRLIIAGRTTVKASMGFVIFQAVDDAEARKVMEEDDAVKAGIMTAEIFQFQTALMK